MKKELLLCLIVSSQLWAGRGYVLRSDAPPPDRYGDALFKIIDGGYNLDYVKAEDVGFIYYLLSVLDEDNFDYLSSNLFQAAVVIYKRLESDLSPEDKTRIITKLTSHMTVGWSNKISTMNMSNLYQIKDIRVKKCLEKFTDHEDPYVKSVAQRLVASLEAELAALSVPNNPTPTPSLKPSPAPSAKPTPLPTDTEKPVSEQTSPWVRWSALLVIVTGAAIWLFRRQSQRSQS